MKDLEKYSEEELLEELKLRRNKKKVEEEASVNNHPFIKEIRKSNPNYDKRHNYVKFNLSQLKDFPNEMLNSIITYSNLFDDLDGHELIEYLEQFENMNVALYCTLSFRGNSSVYDHKSGKYTKKDRLIMESIGVFFKMEEFWTEKDLETISKAGGRDSFAYIRNNGIYISDGHED